ncbi:MAG: FHA domain-containing protein [Acidobacteria bacterium]|nr:FHA domain-containing protein [Acidobacteriota bacterium]
MPQDRLTIGRDPAADILIPEPSVSRIHAEFVLIGSDEILYQDRQSSNGSYLIENNAPVRITQHRLRSDEKLRMGNVEVVVRDLIAVARKHVAERAAAAAQAAQHQKPLEHRSVRMTRCQCGAVKEDGTSCQYCGR